MHLAACFSVVLAIAQLVDGDPSLPPPVIPPLPPALEALKRTRDALRSAEIDWVSIPADDVNKARWHRNSYARNGDLLCENLGDKDGWTGFDYDTGKGMRRYPQRHLVNKDGLWEYEVSTPGVSLRPRSVRPPEEWHTPYEVLDLRGLAAGASPVLQLRYLSRHFGNSQECPVERWEQSMAGDLAVVRGMCNQVVITWYISPAKGWNAERITWELPAPHGITSEMICRLEQYGETWFPREVYYFSLGKLTQTIRVQAASFDRPDAPAEFTPEHMGVEPGSAISIQDGKSRMGPEIPTWNGERIVMRREWDEDVAAGKRDWGPIHKKMFEEREFTSPYDTDEDRAKRRAAWQKFLVDFSTRRHEDYWVRYVREFIDRFDLNAEQQQRAWSIHGHCREQADSLMRRRKEPLITAATEQAKAQQAGDRVREKQLEAEIDRLREPIDRIFEESLKPRLEALPTPAQRRAASSQPTSRPAP